MPRTRAEVETEQAEFALARGGALLAAGDAVAARQWLDRAASIVPEDDTVALQRALTLMALGDAAAATAALQRLADRHDVRELWLGLATARLQRGDAQGAAAALAASLAGHRLPDGDSVLPFADAIAARAGAAGWCGLRRDDLVLVRTFAADDRTAVVIRAEAGVLRGPVVPDDAVLVSVTLAGRDLLGSPLQVQGIRRVEGFVACRDGGLEGWAWHPGDAGRDPELTLRPLAGGGSVRKLVASDADINTPRPLSRPRGFTVPAADLADMGPLSVRGADGRELVGSPLDPGLEVRAAAAAAAAIARALPALGRRRPVAVPWLPTPARLAGPPAVAPRAPERPVAVVVPAYRGLDLTRACLDAVFATVPAGTRVIVVDDATPEPALATALDALAAEGRIRLLRHRVNRGFPAAANAGLREAAALADAPDAVLLNSDTVPTEGWLDMLRRAVHAAGDIGTAAPLSNDAAILSYPDPARPVPPPTGAALHRLAALAARVHGAATVDIPTSVGFCMYIRRECLLATGLFREDAFAQGYGEENDFCIRARHLGWRHVAVPGAYVAHVGGQSFGTARVQLQARNLEVLERLHPGYRAAIMAWRAADTLAPARRALDLARWAERRPKRGKRGKPGAVVLVTHDSAGGVERAVRERCAELAAEGTGTIVLRPVVDLSGSAGPRQRYLPGLCLVGDGPDGGFPNLRFRLPEDFAELVALLRAERPGLLEVHHLLGHHHDSILDLAAALGVPYEVRVHDYAAICARINLVGVGRRYCGEPDVGVCANCVADVGNELEEAITPAELRLRSAADLAGARAVVAPSRDTAARLRRHFPATRPLVRPHETDAGLPPLRAIPALPRRVGVVGALGAAKGYDVLLACARDAAARNLQLSFTVVGHTEDDDRLLDTGRVFITGPFKEPDAVAVILRQDLHLAWLPSVVPETWCYALGQALLAGLPVAVFDLGAQAERIRNTNRGWLLPLGLPAPAINNALLALRTVAGDECAPPGDPFTNNLRSITARS